MTYLSRLLLRSRNLDVARDLADVEEMHRTIMRAFPDDVEPAPRAALGVLFRVEAGKDGTRLVVQSQAQPDWDRLPRGYLARAESKSIDAALRSIEGGRELRFLLVANATRKIARDAGDGDSRQGRRVELTSDEARHGWLVRRGALHGFRLAGTGPHDGVRIDRVIAPSPIGRRGRSKITVRAVRFEGRLSVTDPELFDAAIQRGIGPAKAYGCGLLSVAPR